MKKAFPGHFANDPEDLKRLWEGSLIAMDANVLLSLYRYSEGTKSEFLEVFEKLKDRLWITHHVAKEYFRNRLKVISDQAKLYDAAIQGLVDLRGNFENTRQHPFVSAEVLADCIKSFDLIIGELNENKSRHDQKINDDDIKAVVSDIFDGKVGEPYSVERLEEIIKVGADRYANKIPPGFKDAAKGGGNSLEERLAPYGDYIGWLQLLDKAKADGRGVIFITGDNKEDWWLKQSGKTIGPLPELIDEFVTVTSQKFYMYLPERFLQLAGDFLQQEVSAQAVEEVREARIDEPEQLESPSASELKHLNSFWRDAINRSVRKQLGILDSPDEVSGMEFSDVTPDRKVAASPGFMKRHIELTFQLKKLENEAGRRLLGRPSKEFLDLSDEDLLALTQKVRNERSNLLGMLDSASAIGENFTGE